MEENFLEDALKNGLKSLIRETIEKEIEDEVEKFRQKLVSRKDDYISEIMKGIRIYHERDPAMYGINYKIIFENVTYMAPMSQQYSNYKEEK